MMEEKEVEGNRTRETADRHGAVYGVVGAGKPLEPTHDSPGHSRQLVDGVWETEYSGIVYATTTDLRIAKHVVSDTAVGVHPAHLSTVEKWR
jgi:hypothetical protein